eukprot:CAMPEP_0114133830 /NCGR_PEP_ID=MMETSP0043_2-20121206/13838_1 /TAXON_ID=464988 /ORGANISM="Hemiselmis andersenii, Strain CCMP644" /LENGTH=235 /DNA_ID=CAMNT_0001227439 /DNA_START=379 /DNA_END=1081 /DNA_ORIENTATION=-
MHTLFEFRQPTTMGSLRGMLPPPPLTVGAHAQVLDAGCGFGDNAIYLAKKGHRCVGFDFSDRAIEVANKRASEAGVSHLCEFLVADALDAQAGGLRGRRFGTVLDSACLQCFDPTLQVKYIENMASLMAPGGVLRAACRLQPEPASLVVQGGTVDARAPEKPLHEREGVEGGVDGAVDLPGEHPHGPHHKGGAELRARHPLPVHSNVRNAPSPPPHPRRLRGGGGGGGGGVLRPP